ncbi:MAG TPA: hypothetical protein VK604_23085 [Bryobacteraceae bacterium]|nr:hypothetical protein [Bryobacteraceae bacterium]
MISGLQEVFREAQGTSGWIVCNPGDYIQVPNEAKHAFGNKSSAPAISLCCTTAKLGRFFEEIGRPVSPGEPPATPTPDELQHFVEAAARYGYWLATPEENAAAGVPLFQASPARH